LIDPEGGRLLTFREARELTAHTRASAKLAPGSAL